MVPADFVAVHLDYPEELGAQGDSLVAQGPLLDELHVPQGLGVLGDQEDEERLVGFGAAELFVQLRGRGRRLEGIQGGFGLEVDA
jgi:hypothetical protein